MIVNHNKHSKRNSVASIFILIVIELIFLNVTGFAKEEKNEQQGEMINKPADDTSKTLQPVNVEKNIIINIKKEDEILIQGEQVSLDSIKGRIKEFKNEYPDGNVIITCDKGARFNKIIVDVLDQVRAAKVKNVVVAATKKE